MGQDRYNRSFDNDRVPEPEKTRLERIRFRLRVIREDWIDARKRGKKQKAAKAQARAEKREIRAEAREEKRLAREQKRKARLAEQDSEAANDTDCGYGADGILSDRNRVTADRIFDREVSKRHLSVTGRFWWYLGLLVLAFFFTQILQSKMSGIFFGFVILLPLALLAYTLTARLALRVDLGSQGATVRKGEAYTYEMRLINQSPLAYPFIEARMILPQSNAVRCTTRSVYLSMAPFGDYDMKNEVRFRFRGTYYIGVECFYVYDFFRLFRVRVDIRNAAAVTVLPRRLLMEEYYGYTAGDSTDRKRKFVSADKVEVEDIRDYFPGDPLKAIHWNLSSRSEELIVKDYDSGSAKVTYVYCDLAARFPEEAPCEDAVDRDEKKRARLEKRRERKRERLIKRGKKRNEPYSEEDLRLLMRSDAEKKRDARAERERIAEERLTREIARLAVKHPDRANRLRDRLYDRTRRSAASSTDADRGKESAPQNAVKDVHRLRTASCYEDMNEYCADGIIELTVATVLRELRHGSDVVLLWYDARTRSGISAYPLRAPSELEAILPIFGTAPLTDGKHFVGDLCRLAGDVSGMKQIFVTSAIDAEAVAAFSALPNIADGTSTNEILLYSPDERFLYPEERDVYLAGCREALQRSGFALVKDTLIRKNAIRNGGEEA